MKMEQREVDNMLLSMIQKHFPSLPLSDEHTDWGKWLGFARAVYEAGRASPASVPGGMELSAPTILLDGSGFGILSLPLPKDHWLYAEREYEEDAVEPKDLPAPILTHALRQQVIDALRYAVRSATNCGKETDFDPDALVQNAVYALCGPYGAAVPTPPVSEDRKDAEQVKDRLMSLVEEYGDERAIDAYHGSLHNRRDPSVVLAEINTAIDEAMEGK